LGTRPDWSPGVLLLWLLRELYNAGDDLSIWRN